MKKNILIASLMLIAAFTRLIPHPWNFTAVLAVALFGGVQFKKPLLAILVPLAVMLITDVVLGFHPQMPFVYGCIAITALIGVAISKNPRPMYIVGGSLLASVLFFLITNAAVWYLNPLYPQTFSGLMLSYVAGLPFFQNEIFGSLFFNGLLFGSYALASKRVLARA